MHRRQVIMSGALLLGGLIVCIPTNDTVLKHNKNQKLINYISDRYELDYEESKKVVELVDEVTTNKFPSKIDVLSIIAIESRFKSTATSKKGAKGWMQILYRKVHSELDNILAGVELLSDYHKLLNSEKEAIQAYNVGIKNYREGMRNLKYYNNFIKTKKELINYEC